MSVCKVHRGFHLASLLELRYPGLLPTPFYILHWPSLSRSQVVNCGRETPPDLGKDVPVLVFLSSTCEEIGAEFQHH